MGTIYKYPLDVCGSQSIEIPRGAVPLSVQVQHGCPQLWAIVDSDRQTEVVRVETVATGQPLDSGRMAGMSHVGTYQLRGGSLVFHVFYPMPDGGASDE